MNFSISSAAVYLAAIAIQSGMALGAEYPAPPDQWEEYNSATRKTIIELQPYRQEQSAELANGDTVALINLNPNTNATFVLWVGNEAYHIDNPEPLFQRLALEGSASPDLRIAGPEGETVCRLWTAGTSALSDAKKTGLPFAPICEGKLFLRNAVSGSRTSIERVTDFLRDHVWNGEEIVRLVRDSLYSDEYATFSELSEGEDAACIETGPCPAEIEERFEESAISPIGFGIAFANRDQKDMRPGAWYAAAGFEGVFVSAIQPRTISQNILSSPGPVNALDSIEGKAVDYFVAFDLERYGLGFALGTDHPRLDWSPRPQPSARIQGLPGPDGISDAQPLVRTGMVSPDYAAHTIATFTAGFKRAHGAFKYGDYATIDTGKHYGFIEKGVIYSKLKSGLSTLYVLKDGSVEMKTWTAEDDRLLPDIMFARQNGVPLVETDPSTGKPVPGERVNQWGPGNWSGSANAELRTLRAGACLQNWLGRRFLVYGYFSTATPSAMARTFQAYNCSHAMLLDMNALEHTYLALYPSAEGAMQVEHLISGMSELDKSASGGTVIPRFLGFPDNRDLFFVYERRKAQ